jgi:hypothetical protein
MLESFWQVSHFGLVSDFTFVQFCSHLVQIMGIADSNDKSAYLREAVRTIESLAFSRGNYRSNINISPCGARAWGEIRRGELMRHVAEARDLNKEMNSICTKTITIYLLHVPPPQYSGHLLDDLSL